MKTAIIVVNTLGYKGEQEDQFGPLAKKAVEQTGIEVKLMKVLPNDKKILGEVMKRLADGNIVDVIVTIGGIGLRSTDVVPEATGELLDYELPGISEMIRRYGTKMDRQVMFSRGVAGIRKNTLFMNMPDSEVVIEDLIRYIFPELEDGMEPIMEGRI